MRTGSVLPMLAALMACAVFTGLARADIDGGLATNDPGPFYLVIEDSAGVSEFVVIDDFESYTDEPGQRIWETWVDYRATDAYIRAGYAQAPFAEQTIVHSGKQSLPLGCTLSKSCEKAAAQRSWATPQDWTVDQVDTLVLYGYGRPGNVPASLYVGLTDVRGTSRDMECPGTFGCPGQELMQAARWTQWQIPLQVFTAKGLDLTRIRHMYIGYHASGLANVHNLIYIDDIRLIRAQPGWKSACVYPPAGAVEVVQAPLLRWSPGQAAAYQDIYLGDDANAVASATPETAGIYQGRLPAGQTTFSPAPLEWGKTFFWRVDGVNDVWPESPWKGATWRFTTADFLLLDEFEAYDEKMDTGTRVCETWVECYTTVSTPVALPCEQPVLERKVVHGGKQAMAVDYNNVFRPWLSEYERDWSWEPVKKQDFTTNGVDTLVLFVRGTATNDPAPLYVSLKDTTHKVAAAVHPDSRVVLSPEWVKWKIPLSGLGGIDLTGVESMLIGIGDLAHPAPGGHGRIYIDDIRVVSSTALHPPREPVEATPLWPPAGAVDVAQDVWLQWSAGREARQHDIYLGSDANEVANATPSTVGVYRGRHAKENTIVDAARFGVNEVHYWRIDEINDVHPDSPWRSGPWQFTTADFLVVDDFENYNDAEGTGTRVYETWIPADYYWDDWMLTDPWPHLERTLQHGGQQAMVMDYNNVWEPYYGGYFREFSQPRDWTVGGGDTLVLYVRGWAANVPAPLYVRVEDSAAKQAIVVHPDPQVLLATEWLEWKIPLSQFAGVNVRKVKKIGIGVGDRSNPQPGSAGIVYTDDIRVIKSTP